MCTDNDLATVAQLDFTAFQPVGIRQQADLNEDTFQFDFLAFTTRPIGIGNASHLVTVTQHFSSQRFCNDGHVRQTA